MPGGGGLVVQRKLPGTPCGAGHVGLTHTETQRGRLRTARGRRCVDRKNNQTTPATTSTTPVRQLLGAANEQTAPPPQPAQPRHTNHWAPRTRKRHQQEHRPQRPTESSDPTQHAKGRTGDCPGPRKETTTRRNVIQGAGGGAEPPSPRKRSPALPCRMMGHAQTCSWSNIIRWRWVPLRHALDANESCI